MKPYVPNLVWVIEVTWHTGVPAYQKNLKNSQVWTPKIEEAVHFDSEKAAQDHLAKSDSHVRRMGARVTEHHTNLFKHKSLPGLFSK